MHSVLISLIVFACLYGAALFGMRLRNALPDHYLSDDSKHVLESSLGIIGTMAGLVLGLLVASAFGTYNTQRNELIDLSSKIVVLDRVLAHFGPQATPARVALRSAVSRTLTLMWPKERFENVQLDPSAGAADALYDRIEGLPGTTEAQKSIKGQALGIGIAIAETRWLMFEQLTVSFSAPMMVILVFWFSITFMALGLISRPTPVPIIALCLCAIAVSGAVFIIQEMYSPFQGALQISSAPLREALAHLGR